MIGLLAVAVAATILLLVAVAWRMLPTDETTTVAETVDPTAPWAFVDHRTAEQRAADQSRVDDAWGLR